MSADPYRTSDAAYVAGALAPRDREAYEAHLRTCEGCTAQVLELRRAASLLALAPGSAFLDTGPDAGVPGTLLPRLLDQVQAVRRRRRLAGAVALVATAACAAGVVALTLPSRTAPGDRPPAQARAMVNLVDVPIAARVQVVTHDTWAQVNIWCSYTAGAPSPGNYQAVARTRLGKTELLGSWPGVPGRTAVIRTPTRLHTSDIVSIEILGAGGQPWSELVT